MKDTYKDLVTSARGRLLRITRDEIASVNEEGLNRLSLFGRGMLAGLKLANLEMRWLHREIRKREDQGYRLVWLSPEELEILETFNP